jgi:hypothetical protein
MGDRGRVSGSELASIGLKGIESVRRPDAPAEFTQEQAAIWSSVVSGLPADWFPDETLPILAQYCRHVSRSRRIARLLDRLEKSEEVDVKEYRDLLKSEQEQSGVIATLATKMRIAQQSTYDKSKRKGVQGRRPWDIEG